MATVKKETPMMGQYRSIRNQLPDDVLLFFRLGDFYEMFFDDAVEASRILDIALTKRNKIPMCGIPYHAADTYLAKVLRAGKKVAICDQVEDSSEAKGIVRREVTRIITPGTITEENVLEAHRNHYLAGLCVERDSYGVVFLDLSTGTFWIEEYTTAAEVRDSLAKTAPSECIIPEELAGSDLIQSITGDLCATIVSTHEDWTFTFDLAADFLKRHFRVHSLDGYGCQHCSTGIGAAGAVLHYVSRELKRDINHIRHLKVRRSEDYALLDDATIANLELIESRSAQPQRADCTLLEVLDKTQTPMGGRLLREWLLRPLQQLTAIEERHDAVGTLVDQHSLLYDLRNLLGVVRDMERLISRLSAGGGTPRDVLALKQSLEQVPGLRQRLQDCGDELLNRLQASCIPQPALIDTVQRALVEEPPINLRDGGIFREGYHAELDELRAATTDGKKWLAEYQVKEQQATGIKNLKVRYNKVFGYYIEVTKSYIDAVPENYMRKQTLVNAERFITPELKEYENKILGARDRSVEIEQELFRELREKMTAQTREIQQTAEAIAQLDVISALAHQAAHHHYVKPVMENSDRIEIEGGRHPVIEQLPETDRFVSNDTFMNETKDQIIIITGPNMAGKSTYIRQVALITIMAQMGSFVPADSAIMGVVDRVFTRVGASDDLSRGRSTFMVEMQETANILNNATHRSLIVLDEIGRGTSTFDGISIAWAVVEFLHNSKDVKAKTLFATHYHELTDLERTMTGVKNYNVAVREKNDTIVFIRKIERGGADKSYGIHVARLAGMPNPVIERSQEILANLEEGELSETGQPQIARRRTRKSADQDNQMTLL